MEIVKITLVGAFSIVAFLAYLIMSFVILKDLFLTFSAYYKIEENIKKPSIAELLLGISSILIITAYFKSENVMHFGISFFCLILCIALKVKRSFAEKKTANQ